MSAYDVYLETSAEGLWMAHVPGLPGCFARGQGREEVLARLPQAIAEYYDWLAKHGDPEGVRGPKAAEATTTNGAEVVKIHVVEEARPVGPFHAGDVAALFAADGDPVRPEEMERHFRLMDYVRSDLLALVRHLPQELLGWQPFPEWFSIGRILRHVGDAEEWYVSRLVPPESLPPEWGEDEDLPLLEFLEMERRTALARLRNLTPEERGGMFYPAAWTRHPEEAWTLRKVLRRFLEHEREHTAQVREILDLYRRGLMARLAAEEMALLELLLGLDESTLADEGLDLLLIELGVEGEGLWSWLAEVPEADLFVSEETPGVLDAVAGRSRWLRERAARLAVWKEGLSGETVGSASAAVLKAALAAARRELLAAVTLVPAGERNTRAVCGTWTVKDVIGHVADWEVFGVEGLRHMAAGRTAEPLPVEHIVDIDAWNEAHVVARREQPWLQVWAVLSQARKDQDEVLEDMGATALSRRFLFPWGSGGTAYDWLCVYLRHDREHAAGLRAVLTLPEVYSSL